MAAINTALAGVLALLHNSGIPERFRNNRNEFQRLEEHIRSVIDTGLIRAEEDVHEALAACFEQFRVARQSVENNVPSLYVPAPPMNSLGGPAAPNPAAAAIADTAATAATAATKALSQLFSHGQSGQDGQTAHGQQPQQQGQQGQQGQHQPQQQSQQQQPYPQMQHPQMQQMAHRG